MYKVLTSTSRLMALAALSFAMPAAIAADDIRIGVFVPLTGTWAPNGKDMRNGYELATQDATVKGRKVRLVVEDTAANPSNSLKKVQKLVVEDKVSLLIGGASSAETLAVNAQAARLNVPIITTNALAVQITGEKCSKYLFRTVPNDALGAKASAVMMQDRKELLAKKWFVVYHDFVFGHSNKAEFAKIPGVNIVGEAGRSLGTADWSSAIAQIQSSGADGIYLAMAVGDDLAALVSQVRSYGMKHSIMVPVGIPDSLLQALGPKGVGMITGGLTGSWMQEDENPKMAEFVRAYVAKYKEVPGYQAINAYAAMELVLTAMKAASPGINTKSLIEALETVNAETIIGSIRIRKEDHQAMVGSYVAEAQMVPNKKYGATVAWKVLNPITWEQQKNEPTALGCSMAANRS